MFFSLRGLRLRFSASVKKLLVFEFDPGILLIAGANDGGAKMSSRDRVLICSKEIAAGQLCKRTEIISSGGVYILQTLR